MKGTLCAPPEDPVVKTHSDLTSVPRYVGSREVIMHNHRTVPVPGSVLVGGSEAVAICEPALVLHQLGSGAWIPPQAQALIQEHILHHAQEALHSWHAPLPPVLSLASGASSTATPPATRAGVQATQAITKNLGKASLTGAVLDGALAVAEAALRCGRGELKPSAALKHVARETVTGGVAAAAGSAAVAGLTILTGGVGATAASLVGTAVSLAVKHRVKQKH